MPGRRLRCEQGPCAGCRVRSFASSWIGDEWTARILLGEEEGVADLPLFQGKEKGVWPSAMFC